MNIICKNCHESYSIGSLMTRKLLLTYCTEKCAIENGMSEIEVLRQFEERVPVPEENKPLDEKEQAQLIEIMQIFMQLPNRSELTLQFFADTGGSIRDDKHFHDLEEGVNLLRWYANPEQNEN